jgi:large subunit ribosomal protein L9e
MKTVLATQYIDVPEGVTVDVKAREVVVKGPRGELKRAFKVCMELEIRTFDDGQNYHYPWCTAREGA